MLRKIAPELVSNTKINPYDIGKLENLPSLKNVIVIDSATENEGMLRFEQISDL